MRAWTLPRLLALCGSVLATGLIFRGSVGAAAALLLVFVLLAGANSPLVFPRSIGALEAQRRSAAARPTVGPSSIGGRAARTASGCAPGWAVAPAGRMGSTSGATRREQPR